MVQTAITTTYSVGCPSSAAFRNGDKFTGKQRDYESGLDYFGARYLGGGNNLGRFMTPDPAGSDAADLSTPQTWNMYAYTRNNPTTFTDPNGLCTDNATGQDTGHGWLWCAAHALGLVETQPEQVQDARNFFTKSEVFQNGQYIDPNKLSDKDILNAFQTFNADWQRVANLGGNPAGVLGASSPNFVDLTDPQARTHILEGDQTGGGHRPGTGLSGKSEFPSGWSDEKILNEVSDVATDPASRVTTQGTDKVIEGTREGVDIRVVVRNNRIVTAYPTNTPRNP
jgi:RHS repeat-associated protein